MTDLPSGWERATLADLLIRIEAGKSFTCEPRPAADGEWGVIKVSAMTWGEFREDENKAVPEGREIDPANEIKPGDILVSRANTSEYVGAPVLVGSCRPRLLLSDKSLRLVPSKEISPRWLAYVMSSPQVRRVISERATGTKDSMRNISQRVLGGIEVLVPPVAEQYRIAAALEACLSRLDAAVASVVRSRARTSSLLSRLLGDLVTPSPGEQWCVTSIGEVATTVRNGMFVSRPGTKPDGVPILRIGAVRSLELDTSDIRYTGKSESAVANEGFMLHSGDLLFTRYNGNPNYVGACAVVPEGVGPLTYPDKLIRVIVDRKVAHPGYLAMACSSGLSREAIRSSVKTTAGQAGISGRQLRDTPLKLPSMGEQARRYGVFMERRKNIKRLTDVLQLADQRAGHLRVALLGAAFEGRLTSQDSSEEPASVLLNRVAVARVGTSSARRRIGPAGSGARADSKEETHAIVHKPMGSIPSRTGVTVSPIQETLL